MPQPTRQDSRDAIVATTLEIPQVLWEKAHRRATEDAVSLEELVVCALREYLGVPEHPIQLPYGLQRKASKRAG